jgi:hypothetical protein
MDTYELDEYFDELLEKGGDRSELVGLTVEHHFGVTGTTRIAKHGGVVLDIMCACNRCEKGVLVSVSSGLHAGAWCYVRDEETGEYIANLRDQVPLCDECAE